MADPLSITVSALSIAKVLFQAGKSIYDFHQQSKETDENVQRLRNQVEGLAKLAQSIARTLENPSLESIRKDNDALWKYVKGAIEGCADTTTVLITKLKSIQRHRDVFKAAWRQFRLSLIQGDLDNLLSGLKTHSVNLQVALANINVIVSINTPDIIVSQLTPRLDKLERMIFLLSQRPGPATPTSSSLDLEYLRTISLDENTQGLQKVSIAVISTASTVAGFTRSGTTTKTALALEEPVFEQFHRLDDKEVAIPESTTGSELGGPFDPKQKAMVYGWLDDSYTLETLEERSSSGALSPPLPSGSSDLPYSSKSEITETYPELFDPDSDDDLDYHITHGLTVRAQERYDARDFSTAEELITKIFREASHLSFDQKRSLALGKMHLIRGHCLYEQGNFKEAEAEFLGVVEEPIQDSNDLARVFNAYEALAVYNLRRRNCEAAKNHCRQAEKGRRKASSIGKNHPDYHRALRILALIEWAKGEKYIAEVMASRLPDGYAIVDFEATLNSEYPQLSIQELPNQVEVIQKQDKFVHEGRPKSWTTASTNERSAAAEWMSTALPVRSKADSQDVTAEFAQSEPTEAQNPPEEFVSRSIDPNLNKDEFDNAFGDFGSSSPDLLARSLTSESAARAEVDSTKSSSAPTQRKSLSDGHSVTTIRSLTSNPPPVNSTSEQLAAARLRQSKLDRFKDDKGLLRAVRNGDVHLVTWILVTSKINLGQLYIKFDDELKYGSILCAVAKLPETSDSEAIMVNLLRYFEVNGTSVDSQFTTNGVPGWTPLQVAIQRGNYNFSNFLLQAGADVDGKHPEKPAPLEIAAANRNLELCQLLLDHGAMVEGNGTRPPKSPKPFQSPLVAASQGHYNPRILDRNIPSDESDVRKALAVFDLLVLYGADVNGHHYWGMTPLMIAARSLCLRWCEYFISKGADACRKCEDSGTALAYLTYESIPEAHSATAAKICEYLVSCGTDIDARDKDGDTALMACARYEHVDLCRFLVSKGANPKVLNNNGKSATRWIPAFSPVRKELERILSGNENR